ncbi:MAG: propionyl-CoA carboxylase [Planctomycetes bacterium]|nr:propionyl-CoA carboxylase [Planctomycetota bacterium]
MAHVPLEPIGAPLEQFTSAADAADNRARMSEREAILYERRAEVAAGWGEKYVERVHKKGKLTTAERIDLLADDGAPRVPIGTFVNYGTLFGGKLKSPNAGVWCLFTRIAGRWAMVIANDNTVASGSWWPQTPEKIERAQEMALRLRIPVVYLVDCSGLYLPEQSKTFSGAKGAGHIFTMNARLSAQGVPQVAGVFGDCIAGGGYMPIISDRVIMTEQAYMVIAGAALIKGAKGQNITSLDIGGPEVHVHRSGCADERVPDDATALRRIRAEIERLPTGAADYYRGAADAAAPRFDPAELASIVPVDHRVAYDPRQVLARLVDSSLFWELWPHLGQEIVVGVGRIGGLYAGFVINNPGLIDDPQRPGYKRPGGILYREGIAKLSQFARACSSDGLPMVWLQDISGFDIGEEAERLGLLGLGSSLIYANSTQQTPVLTVLLRRASGAGYYAMSGRPYDPIVQLSTPVSRLSVMEGRTLSIASHRTKLDDDFEIKATDADEREAIAQSMKDVEARIEQDMDPYVAARQLDTDEIVTLGELRGQLESLVELCYHSLGYRTVKNPRIWSLHDLQLLTPPPPRTSAPCGVRREPALELLSPEVGILEDRPALGAALVPGAQAGVLRTLEGRLRLEVPEGVLGRVTGPPPEGPQALGYGDVFLVLEPIEGAGDLAAPTPADEALDASDLVIRSPQVGRFYHRPAPDRPAYLTVGQEINASDTLGLIEVMKTFFQVRYGDPSLGTGLPERARLVRHLVEDGEDVQQGQPILELELL